MRAAVNREAGVLSDMTAKFAWHDLWFAVRINIFGLGLMALWNTLNTVILPGRVEDTAPGNLRGSALGLISLLGIGLAAVIQPIAGRASDRIWLKDRRRPFIGVGSALALPCLLIFGWAPAFLWLVTAYVLLQITVNVAQAAYQALIPDLVDESGRGLASGVKNALTVLGAAIGLGGAQWLLSSHLGQSIALGFLTLLFLISAILTLFWVPRVPPLPPCDRAASVKGLLDPRALWISFAETFSQHRTFRRAVLAQFLFLLGAYPAQRFLLFFLQDRFGSERAIERASLGLAGAILVGAAAAAGAGVLSDHLGRAVVLRGSVGLAVAGLLGLAFAGAPLLAAAVGAVLAAGIGGFQAVNWALLSDDIAEGQGGRFYGLANIATAGASALAGLFGPLLDLVDHLLPAGTYRRTFGLAALVCLTALLPLRGIGKRPGADS